MKNKVLQLQPLNTDIGTLLLRLIFGGLFFYHGYDSLVHYQLYLSMSEPVIGLDAKLAFNLVVFTQLICGLFVAAGFLTRLAVLPLSFMMGVAVFVVHAKDPFHVKEPALLYLLLTSVIFILGSGRFSVDSLLLGKRK
jgi:putative oxidoreductase